MVQFTHNCHTTQHKLDSSAELHCEKLNIHFVLTQKISLTQHGNQDRPMMMSLDIDKA